MARCSYCDWDNEPGSNFCANPEGAEIDGEFTITAWNGDKIQGTYHTLAHADTAANEIAAAGFFQITGGTGRFEEASGTGSIAAGGSLAPPFKFDGGLFGHITF